MARKAKLQTRQRKALCKAYVGGAGLRELSILYRISTPIVTRILLEEGVEIRGRGAQKKKLTLVEQIVNEIREQEKQDQLPKPPPPKVEIFDW